MSLPPTQPWRAKANCKGMDRDIFYPEDGRVHELAERICTACPVLDDCREYAILHETHGIWGATGEKQREMIRERRNIRVIGTAGMFGDSGQRNTVLDITPRKGRKR